MMENKKEFQWLKPPFLLVPYVEDKGIYSPSDLVAIYHRLKDEGLWDVVFHDNPDMTLRGFIEFFGIPSVMMQVINIVDGDKIQEMAAISWLSGVEQYGDRTRGVASFCVFKHYQTPVITDKMAKFVLDYWFDCLGMDIVVGMTPEANVQAVNFIKRIGFIESSRLPGYSRYQGKFTNCVITYIDKPQYKKLSGG
jgi:RimJ/RimL family protein N-acetyltransferase